MSTPDELFPPASVAMDSPRLAWIKRHGIRRHHNTSLPNDADYDPWCVWLPSNDSEPGAYPQDCDMPGGIPRDPEACGYGKTEDEAITHLAKLHGLRLWNEEGQP